MRQARMEFLPQANLGTEWPKSEAWQEQQIAANRCQVKFVDTYSGIPLKVPPAKKYSTSFSKNRTSRSAPVANHSRKELILI